MERDIPKFKILLIGPSGNFIETQEWERHLSSSNMFPTTSAITIRSQPESNVKQNRS